MKLEDEGRGREEAFAGREGGREMVFIQKVGDVERYGTDLERTGRRDEGVEGEKRNAFGVEWLTGCDSLRQRE